MDTMTLSLDDIIKKNKLKKNKGVGVKKIGALKKGPNKKLGKAIQKKSIPQKKPIDARMKLIQKNRKKIIDAREVIAEHARSNIRDARQLLSNKKKQDLPKTRPAKIQRNRPVINKLTVQNDLMDEDEDLDFDDLSTFKSQPITSIRRTVKNDIYRSSSPPRNMPRLPVFSINNREREPSPSLDPFDCYVVPTRRPLPPLPPAPPRIERAFNANKMSAHMDAYIPKPPSSSSLTQKGILRPSLVRGSGGEHDDRFESDRYLGSEARSSSNRYSNESAGIFAKIPDYKSSTRPKGYRIIISNLVSSVSESDVEELFSEIGELVSAKLIKAGTAEVIFRNAGDDERAHDVYHNRLIDGQPMKITLTGGVTRSAQYNY